MQFGTCDASNGHSGPFAGCPKAVTLCCPLNPISVDNGTNNQSLMKLGWLGMVSHRPLHIEFSQVVDL